MNKPEDFYELLLMIKQRPGAFLGKKSALKLKSFLDGFEYAMFLCNNESFTKNYAEFKKRFEIKHNIRNTDSWYEYLIRHFDDDKAFDVFFSEAEEFFVQIRGTKNV
ncbi:MAG: hypothetical protein GX638_09765 [Crenarchaeota archaeon]|nr:hypothetical protein [Thermoproteota archaeon]